METTDSFEPTAPGSASVVRVDLPSLVAKPIQMPEQPGTPSVLKNGARVLVFPTQLIVTYPGRYLAVCDRASGKWQYFTAIKPDRDVVLIDGQLFLTVKDDQSLGVMRFDVTTKATELLVSTRRNPPESPLDVATLQIIGAFANEAGEFVLSIQTREGGETKRAFWAWAPATRTWRESRDEKQAADFFKRMNGFIRGGVLRAPSGNETDENARAVMAAAPGRSERPGLPLLVDFTHPPGVPFGKREGRDGSGKDMVRRPSQWRQCAQGYVFDSGGYRFWFLSNEQFDGFTKASPPVP